PPSGIGHIGGLDTGQFAVILAGGMIGLMIMRFAANVLVELLQKRPSLEVAAFLFVVWVGLKLSIITLAHPDISLIQESFPHSILWKSTFYIVLIGIAVVGWFASNREAREVNSPK